MHKFFSKSKFCHLFVGAYCSGFLTFVFSIFPLNCKAEVNRHIVLNENAKASLAKSQALQDLKNFQNTTKEQISKLDQDIKDIIYSSKQFSLPTSSRDQFRGLSENSLFQAWDKTKPTGSLNSTKNQEKLSEAKLQQILNNTKILIQKRSELVAKQKFIDQLIFQIDSKWNQQNLRSFLENSFLEMALNESLGSDPDLQYNQFLIYSSISVREIPEPSEDLISFILAYTNYSSVSSPKSPLGFAAERSYSNGLKSTNARPTKLENLNNLIESRLKIIKDLKKPSLKQNSQKNDDSDNSNEEMKDLDPDDENLHETQKEIGFDPKKS